MSTATAGAPPDTGIPGNPYDKLYHYDDEDYYDPHCFFSSGLAQNRKRLGFIATCSTVQCKDAGSAGTFLTLCQPFFLFVFAMSYVSVKTQTGTFQFQLPWSPGISRLFCFWLVGFRNYKNFRLRPASTVQRGFGWMALQNDQSRNCSESILSGNHFYQRGCDLNPLFRL